MLLTPSYYSFFFISLLNSEFKYTKPNPDYGVGMFLFFLSSIFSFHYDQLLEIRNLISFPNTLIIGYIVCHVWDQFVINCFRVRVFKQSILIHLFLYSCSSLHSVEQSNFIQQMRMLLVFLLMFMLNYLFLPFLFTIHRFTSNSRYLLLS
jgi:hypothetical protein